LKEVEKCGCPTGAVRGEKLHNVVENMDYLRKTMTEVNSKLFYGLLILIIIAFMAGVNVTNELIKLIPR